MSNILLLGFGGRNIWDINILLDYLDELHIPPEYIDEVVEGGADGADFLFYQWGGVYQKKQTIMPAHWDRIPPNAKPWQIGYSKKNGRYYKGAGPERNREMRDYLLRREDRIAIGLWDGVSSGSRGMRDLLLAAGVEPFIKIVDPTKQKGVEIERPRGIIKVYN